jgi:hypothetical protein
MTDEALITLLMKVRLPCTNPSGRFGEDDCDTCVGCRINREVEKRKQDRRQMLKSRKKKEN